MLTKQTIYPPGEIIREYIECLNISEINVAESLGLTIIGFLELLNGKVRINKTLARKLSETFGESIDYWLTVDINYWESITDA